MKTKLRAIEHRAVSGVWLLGEDFEDIIISEETYNWLWRNIYNICDNPRLIKMFWSNSSQYFDYRLQGVIPDYSSQNGELVINNKEQVDTRNDERNRFLEFHYALGGLMLYRKQYKAINYLFEYSQSHPPKYVLLPETMTQIFSWFESFRNEFKHKTPIDFKYYFPELDNLGNRRQVNYWICCYIVTLFLRQYSLHQYYIYQDFTALPNLPDDVLELSSWLDSASFFERCLNTVLSNKELIKDLEFDKIVEKSRDDFFTFINGLKEAIKNKIGQQKLNAKLSDEKIQSFYNQSNAIISSAFEEYNSVFIPKETAHLKSELKLSVNGEITIMSKSAFTDNDVPSLNYDTVFAGAISTNKIKRLIPNSFLIARTKRYLLNKENINVALAKVIGNNKDIIIIGVNVGFQTKEIIDSSKFKSIVQYIPSTEYHSLDTLFVLRRNDLPAIEHKELKEDELRDLQLKCINENLKIYASVIDINKEENRAIKEKWNLKEEPDNQDLKVQIAIAFLSVIYWKNEREIIQINIASEYREQGIQNDINEVEPLSTNDDK
jgi:hypothetical protein